jgi:hypothetical protein
MKVQQTLEHQERSRMHLRRTPERAVAVVVDGLEDRLAATKMHQMVSEDVDMIGVGMHRSDSQLSALAALLAVVVVGTYAGDAIITHHSDQSAGEAGLAGA